MIRNRVLLVITKVIIIRLQIATIKQQRNHFIRAFFKQKKNGCWCYHFPVRV